MAHDSTTRGPFGVVETCWQEGAEADGNLASGEHSGELHSQHKSILWNLLKQVRPGMDASRIILPTFCLEPRSFLDKASDVFFHADFLTDAAHAATPEARFLSVARWFVTYFYKKPKGLQKPYNPLLGEIFRCLFELPAHPSGVPASRALLVAEQVGSGPLLSLSFNFVYFILFYFISVITFFLCTNCHWLGILQKGFAPSTHYSACLFGPTSWLGVPGYACMWLKILRLFLPKKTKKKKTFLFFCFWNC
jgi:hypothetical protein